MNNSKLAIESISLTLDEPTDNTEKLQIRESELIMILEAIRKISESDEWSTLKIHVFDGLTEALTREIHNEARKENPDTLKLNRLAGQLKWAEKFSDLSKLDQGYRLELTQIRKLLYGKTKEILG